MPFRLRLERLVEDRRFLPQLRWAVSGKGTAMILGAPYAPTRTFSSSAASTAQQLAADALTVNGVGIGWALDWQIVDWLVPAGAWSVHRRHRPWRCRCCACCRATRPRPGHGAA